MFHPHVSLYPIPGVPGGLEELAGSPELELQTVCLLTGITLNTHSHAGVSLVPPEPS